MIVYIPNIILVYETHIENMQWHRSCQHSMLNAHAEAMEKGVLSSVHLFKEKLRRKWSPKEAEKPDHSVCSKERKGA